MESKLSPPLKKKRKTLNIHQKKEKKKGKNNSNVFGERL